MLGPRRTAHKRPSCSPHGPTAPARKGARGGHCSARPRKRSRAQRRALTASHSLLSPPPPLPLLLLSETPDDCEDNIDKKVQSLEDVMVKYQYDDVARPAPSEAFS